MNLLYLSPRRLAQALVLQLFLVATLYFIVSYGTVVTDKPPVEIYHRNRPKTARHGKHIHIHVSTTSTRKPAKNVTHGLSDEEMVKLIENYQRVLDEISKELNSTRKGKKFLRSYNLPMVGSANRAVDYVDLNQYRYCNKSLPCSCEGPQYTCDPPDCPPQPRDKNFCAGKPTCFEMCRVEEVHINRPGESKENSTKSDGKDSSKRHLMEEGRNSKMVREMVKALPEESLEPILDDLVEAWLAIANRKARPVDGHKSKNRVLSEIAAGISIGVTIVDTMTKVIDLTNKEAVDMYRAQRCPCWEDECPGLGIRAAVCEGVCGNNPGCPYYQCTCPGEYLKRPGKPG